jgi:dTDP-4-dehydrorhamnose reductase
MRYLVTGYSGQLGYDVVKELLKRGVKEADIIATTSKTMNLTNSNDVMTIVRQYKPDTIIHCAAWTKVDDAEDNYDACYNVNVNGAKNIVEAAKTVDAKVLYVSTDYVFDGTKNGLYNEEDKKNPLNVYGKTKSEGEDVILSYPKSFVARTSWVFGINGHNFIRTMLKLSETHQELNVVCDQIGSPTYTVDLAKTIVDLVNTDKYGLYHVTNEGYCSWAEFAKYIFSSNNIEMKINEIPTSEYPQKAKRPLNSRLSKNKLTQKGFNVLPTWQNAVDRYNEELKLERKLK